MIVTLSGASGAGKSTIARALLIELPSARQARSYTTRQVRPSDADYIVPMSDREFGERAASNEFAWTATAHGNRYGTLRSSLESGLIDNGSWLIIDVAPTVVPEVLAVAAMGSQRKRLRTIYLLAPPAEVLRARLSGRGDSSASIEERIRDCRLWDREATASGLYDLFVEPQRSSEAAAKKVREFLLASGGLQHG